MSVRASHNFAWIAARTGCVLTPNARLIEVVDSSGKIRGQVAYDNWTRNAVQVHMAVDAPSWWRQLLVPAFEYGFAHAGIMLAVISASNARSLALTRRFGFRETHRVQDGWAEGEDLVCLELRRAECRFLQQPARKAA